MPIYANYSAFFASESAKIDFLKWFKSPALFWQRNAKTFENSLILRPKLKIKIGFIFYHGRDFCILLDFSVHLLLKFRKFPLPNI